MRKRIVIATGNKHKISEIAEMLKPLGVQVLGAHEAGGMPEVIEDGETFAENAVKKATEVARVLRVPVLADDSGLAVDALRGRPGVYSARYSGPEATDQSNVRKLLGELAGVSDRNAKFVCVIAVADCDGELIGTVCGESPGRIIDSPRGQGGFGYDPVFVPAGYRQTFAELPPEVKNSLSHRGSALRQLVASQLLERVVEDVG